MDKKHPHSRPRALRRNNFLQLLAVLGVLLLLCGAVAGLLVYIYYGRQL